MSIFWTYSLSILFRDPSMGDEQKQQVLIGSLLYTGLIKDEVRETIANHY